MSSMQNHAEPPYSPEVMRAFTSMNCSIGVADWRQALREAPFSRVELWWPWDTPTPTQQQIADFSAEILHAGKTLIALNMFGGALRQGERGVLHQPIDVEAWVDALAAIYQLTGVKQFNLLLGRGASAANELQLRQFGQLSARVHERFGGVAMLEPLSGFAPGDYPVTDVQSALHVLELADAPHAGILFDVYHLWANGQPWELILEDATNLQKLGKLQHVQFADFPGRGAPGTGELDYLELCDHLRKVGYCGDIALEHL